MAVVQTPAAVVAPSDEQPVTIDAAQMEPKAAVEHQEAGDAPLKPDRLSYLLNKLFEAAKRETPAHTPQAHTIDAEAPPSQQSVTDDASAEDILDLRVPEAGTAEQQASNSLEFGLSKAEPTEAQPATLREPAPEIVEPPAPAELPVIEIAPPEIELARLPDIESDDAESPEPQAPEPILPQPEAVSVESAPPPSSAPSQPVIRPRPAEPVARFGSRTRPPRPKAAPAQTFEAKTATPIQTAEVRDPEVKSAAPTPTTEMRDVPAKPVTPERAQEPVEAETPATMPRRDWKLGSPSPGQTPKAAEFNPETRAKKSETTFRLKTGSGALATVDAPPPGASASAEKMPGKYYGPRYAKESDEETTANSPAQQRALSLADALTEFYAKAGQPQPPMHTTDRATLQRIIANGKLEAPRRRGAPWSMSGMSRRGEVAIRLEARRGTVRRICSVHGDFRTSPALLPARRRQGQLRHPHPGGASRIFRLGHAPMGACATRLSMKIVPTDKIDEGALPVAEDAAAVRRPDLTLNMVHGFLRHILQSLETDAEPWRRQLACTPRGADFDLRDADDGTTRARQTGDDRRRLGRSLARGDAPADVGQGVLPHLAAPLGALAERREAAKTDAKQHMFLKRYASRPPPARRRCVQRRAQHGRSVRRRGPWCGEPRSRCHAPSPRSHAPPRRRHHAADRRPDRSTGTRDEGKRLRALRDDLKTWIEERNARLEQMQAAVDELNIRSNALRNESLMQAKRLAAAAALARQTAGGAGAASPVRRGRAGFAGGHGAVRRPARAASREPHRPHRSAARVIRLRAKSRNHAALASGRYGVPSCALGQPKPARALMNLHGESLQADTTPRAEQQRMPLTVLFGVPDDGKGVVRVSLRRTHADRTNWRPSPHLHAARLGQYRFAPIPRALRTEPILRAG